MKNSKYFRLLLASFVCAAGFGLFQSPVSLAGSYAKEITAFKFADFTPEIVGSMDQIAGTIKVAVPEETYLANMVATYTLHEGVYVTVNGVNQESGVTENDFSDTVVYTVHAEDGSTRDYQVDVYVEAEPGYNLALNRPTTAKGSIGSGSSSQSIWGGPELAVDGNKGVDQKVTRWSANGEFPLWIAVDLGIKTAIDRMITYEYNNKVNAYRLQISNSSESWGTETGWTDIAQGTVIGPRNEDRFSPIYARYVRLRIDGTSSGGASINEIEIYNGTPQDANSLKSVNVSDGLGRSYASLDTVQMLKGETLRLDKIGTMSDNTQNSLESASVAFASNKTDVASVDPVTGIVTGHSNGVAQITLTATLRGITKSNTVYVNVLDPETVIMDLSLLDSSNVPYELGVPVLIEIGSPYPTAKVHSYFDGSLSGFVLKDGSEQIDEIQPQLVSKGGTAVVGIPGVLASPGLYTIHLTLSRDGMTDFVETLYFMGFDPAQKKEGEGTAVFTDAAGKLVYVPDYRGNTVLDFSNAGYQGGGARIPDVQAREVVEPADGDDTQSIQAAIDRVSALPIREDGFRGAVLLKKGTYQIGGQLTIRASGVVLRGEGSGTDGTVLLATGTKQASVINVKGSFGPKEITGTDSPITDAYVPVGSRTFHVQDPELYRNGDLIYVVKKGNDRWINEIGMDAIKQTAGVVQWTAPWDVRMERVITNIRGSEITVDAPIVDAIERRWGGGFIQKLDDSGRIEQVGVENLRGDTIVDTSAAKMKTDVWGISYTEDEAHANMFVSFANVKNGWARELEGKRFHFSLVSVAKSSKWITVQDSTMTEMTGQITGSRRYAFDNNGQLTLFQRLYAETARHSFVMGQRQVTGPNVFLDGTSKYDQTRSEPHQRWSVGGLYDSMKTTIAIQDRGNQGSGHGWSGANFTVWNTEESPTSLTLPDSPAADLFHVAHALIMNRPPTATNYAVGIVGRQASDLVPGRDRGYWDSYGAHVSPSSLYLKQIEERLGSQALQNIGRQAVGGGSLDMPAVDEALPGLSDLRVDGVSLADFVGDKYDYTIRLPFGATGIPSVAAESADQVNIVQSDYTYGQATVQVTNEAGQSVVYTVKFNGLPVYGVLPHGFGPVGVSTAASNKGTAESVWITFDEDMTDTWSGSADGDWLQFDLGREQTVGGLLVAWYTNYASNVYAFDIYVSADAAVWSKVGSGQSEPYTNDLQVAAFQPVQARYVKLTMHGSQYTAATRLNEVMVLGELLNDASLSGLSLEGVPLEPEFGRDTLSYRAIVPSGTASIAVKASLSNSKHAAITVNGAAVVSGAWSWVPLTTEENDVDIQVTAADGTTRLYSIAVLRLNGDLNGDGQISAGDFAIIAASIGMTADDPGWLDFANADLNHDGIIDRNDLDLEYEWTGKGVNRFEP